MNSIKFVACLLWVVSVVLYNTTVFRYHNTKPHKTSDNLLPIISEILMQFLGYFEKIMHNFQFTVRDCKITGQLSGTMFH